MVRGEEGGLTNFWLAIGGIVVCPRVGTHEGDARAAFAVVGGMVAHGKRTQCCVLIYFLFHLFSICFFYFVPCFSPLL